MRLFLKLSLAWISTLLVCIFIYGQFCDWFFTKPDFMDAASSKRAWNLAQKGKEYDYAVLGNSRSYSSFNMKMLSDSLHKKGINLGAPGSGFIDNYLTLYLFLKYNTVKEVFLQIDIYSLDSYTFLSNAFHKYHFVQYYTDPIVKNTIDDFSSPREIKSFTIFPELRYVKYNKYFSLKEILRRYINRETKSPFDATLGGRLESGFLEKIVRTDKFPERKSNLSPKDFYYLNKILDLCREQDIIITAYKAPEYERQIQSIKNYDEVLEKVSTRLASEKIPFILPSKTLESNPQYFLDGIHISRACIKPFTNDFLIKYKQTRANKN